ncbi:predicted protein [Sclerotinia sclerotiorum 1980 UF-70]|uniref:Uncharacterized protein n=1 Tax=Sclerotinia sclerotiorum (strain ATCC 18683 / 1980 / Ss-1) TaxID=665079 RepID=A7E5S6_SCLS1|nr:predicted protein [Sclerotinia sclerotiorum 1980 UF-70]EDN91248.1 predicted protein [Sclerotinia sclerotiorum 1980 UF-70]
MGVTDVITVVSQAEGPDRPKSQPESESRDLEAQDNHEITLLRNNVADRRADDMVRNSGKESTLNAMPIAS